jgi:DNA topoisomerase IA
VTRGAFPTDDRIFRAQFSSITPKDITNAFSCLGRPNQLLSKSVDARQELDLKVDV